VIILKTGTTSTIEKEILKGFMAVLAGVFVFSSGLLKMSICPPSGNNKNAKKMRR
jgi:hypothetical protein